MPTITGLRVPADDHTAIERVTFEPNDLPFVTALVGGYLEAVHISPPPASFWCNEDGKLQELPVNRRATALLWAFSKPWAYHDYLVGDVLIAGHPDDHGDATSAPDDLLALIDTHACKVEVQIHGSVAWSTNAMLFTDWFSAATFVIDLGRRWTEVSATRISLS